MRTLILSFCVAVFCLQLEQSAAAKICGVNGYDVNLLSRGDYWMVTEATNQRKCFRRSGTEVEDIAYCEFYYSFCHALPDDICPNITRNASVCQKVFYNSGSITEYDMGRFSTEHEYHPTNTTSYDGFETFWTGEPVTTAECSGNTAMLVSFKCDRDSVWEPGKQNVTKYLDTIFRIDCALCSLCFGPFGLQGDTATLHIDSVYIVQVNYEGACYEPPTVAPGNCKLDPYDITTLANKLYWTATMPEDSCIGGGATTCTIAFSFCHALPPNITETCNGASVCQLTTTAGETTSYSMGMFENYTQFRPNEDKHNPGFNVEWYNGSFTQDCLEGLTTEMIFLCNESAKWTTEDQTANLIHVYYSRFCSYILEFHYNGACDNVGPIPNQHNHDDTLQIAEILVGIFVPLSVIFLVVIIILASVLAGCWWMRRTPRQLQSEALCGEPLLSEAADDEEDSLNDDDSSAVDLEPQHKPSQA